MFIHLFEAILINIKRLPKYFIQSSGASLVLSLILIFSEIFSIPISILMDIWALKLRIISQGKIRTGKNEFVSMKQLPNHTAVSLLNAFSLFKVLPTKQYNEKKSELFTKTFESFSNLKLLKLNRKTWANTIQEGLQITNQAIHFLEQHPFVLCMSRHIFESERRVFERFWQEMNNIYAEQAKLNSQSNFLTKVFLCSFHYLLSLLTQYYYFAHLKLHSLTFSLAIKMDYIALPLQLNGIPILVNDLPKIPSILQLNSRNV